jgi:hypothetical protein
MPEIGTKRIPHQRTTTFVGALEPMYNLMAWKQRQTVIGMGQRKDLVLAAAAAGPGDKTKLNEIAEKACEHALSSAAATTGTALHSLTERVDRGQPLGVIPDSYLPDIKAYEHATRAMEHLHIEQFRVHDDWRVAGTADRIIRYRGRIYVADIKTGNIEYDHKIAMQLAMYAHSIPYNIETDTREPPTPALNLDRGLIIHLPAETGTCRLVWVDIQRGWRACGIAKTVWDWRAVKDLTWDDTGEPEPALKPTYIELAMSASTVEELRELWRDAKNNMADSADFLTACNTRKAELNGA